MPDLTKQQYLRQRPLAMSAPSVVVDPDDAVNSDDSVSQRRAKVMELHLRGVSQSQMAKAVGVSRSQIRQDLEVVQRWIQQDRVGSLGDKVSVSVSVRKQVQYEAWRRLSNTGDSGVSAPGLLTAVLQSQDAIDRLEGVEAPEKVNAATIAELFNEILTVAGEVGGMDLQRRFVLRLKERAAQRGRQLFAAIPLPGEPVVEQ